MPFAVIGGSTVTSSPLRSREVIPAALPATAGALATTAGASQFLPVGPRVQPAAWPGGARGPSLASLASFTPARVRPGSFKTAQGLTWGSSPPAVLAAAVADEKLGAELRGRTVGSLPSSGSAGLQDKTVREGDAGHVLRPERQCGAADESLNAELWESLAEEAALEAAVARKRSLAVLQASRIAALRRSTAELLRRRDLDAEAEAEAEQSDSCDRTPTPPRGEAEEEEEEEGSGEDDNVWLDQGADDDDDGDPSGALSLEAATAQLGRLRELRTQVAHLEEELHARTAEVERMSAEIGAVELQEQQMLGSVQGALGLGAGVPVKATALRTPG